MKKVMMLLGVLFLLAAPGMAQNVQKEVENMYERRAQKAEAERLAAEQIQAQIRKQEEAWQRHLQQNWEYLAKDGAKRFDRKRVEEAIRPFMSLNEDVLDNVLSRRGEAIKFLPESTYNIAYMADKVWTYKELYRDMGDEDASREFHKKFGGGKIWEGFEKRKIHNGPLLLVKKPDGDCVVVDSGYKAFDNAKCDDYPSYVPTVESRKKALRGLGFSENTVQKYAVKNPWNLETFVACDKFEGHELVEKVVVAWRHATFTDTKQKKTDKQYRYVFIQNGKEHEQKPQANVEIPKCIKDRVGDGFNMIEYAELSRGGSFYTSLTQSQPPEQAISMGERTYNGRTHYLQEIPVPVHGVHMMSSNEEWGF